MYVIGESLDEILIQLIKKVLEDGKVVSPRGMEVKEIIGVGFELSNPRKRIQYNPARHINVHLGIGEFLWYFSGSDLLNDIKYYNRKYENYSDDDITLNGAYGKRIFSNIIGGKSQWENIRELLKRDSDSRQAVIHIFSAEDIVKNSKDVPCTCTLQFFVRENKLDLIVYMRSNDLVWGTPYDVFNFTLMQEIMANELNVQLGRYVHYIGSAHIYSYHIEQCNNIINEQSYSIKEMAPLDLCTLEQVYQVIDCAKQIREGRTLSEIPTTQTGKDMVALLVEYAQKKKGYKESVGAGVIPSYYII